MCRDGNHRILLTLKLQLVYPGCTPIKALDVTDTTQFKGKTTRLLPLNTIAAEAPITAKKGEYRGLWADILLARSET